MEESELIERARCGEIAAYEALVRRYQDLAVRAAHLITGNEEEAEDVAQEAFLRAFQAFPRFRSGAPFRPWLLRIVTNEARNRRKAAARRIELTIRASATVPSTGAPSPESAALAEDLQRAIAHALTMLRDEDRLVIVYRYFLDLSEAEMAEALACRPGTVKSRLSRALARLRGRLDMQQAGDERKVKEEAHG